MYTYIFLDWAKGVRRRHNRVRVNEVDPDEVILDEDLSLSGDWHGKVGLIL